MPYARSLQPLTQSERFSRIGSLVCVTGCARIRAHPCMQKSSVQLHTKSYDCTSTVWGGKNSPVWRIPVHHKGNSLTQTKDTPNPPFAAKCTRTGFGSLERDRTTEHSRAYELSRFIVAFTVHRLVSCSGSSGEASAPLSLRSWLVSPATNSIVATRLACGVNRTNLPKCSAPVVAVENRTPIGMSMPNVV